MDLLFVTTNENKRREAAEILGLELEATSLDLPEIQTLDFAEVAREKARAACSRLGRPVLVEDSGLVLEAWNGLPGALTKWFLSSIGIEGLLRMANNEDDRAARAVCAVAVAGVGEEVRVFVGEVRGTLAREPRGGGGFGWDPIFVPDGREITYAEMGEEKSADSHRTRALRATREWLEERAGMGNRG